MDENDPEEPECWGSEGGLACNLRIRFTSHNINLDAIPQAPPSPSQSCIDASSNNGEVPPFSGAGLAGSLATPSQPVPVDVSGPEWNNEEIVGFGEFGSESTLHTYTNELGGVVVDQWTMIEDAPTTVGTSTIESSVDGFKLDLLNVEVLSSARGGSSFLPAGNLFHLVAVVDGVGYELQAKNVSSIYFSTLPGGAGDCPPTVASCPVTGSFTLEYDDVFEDHWELEVAQATWVPD